MFQLCRSRPRGPRKQRCLRLGGLGFQLQMLARTGDGESLFVEQLLDANKMLHIPLPIEPLSLAALLRTKLRELCLPETQHVSRQIAQLRYLTDTEVQLIRYHDVVSAGTVRSGSFLGA